VGEPPGSTAVAQPLVSVVVDNYNYAAYLSDAIDSALAQTWPHVEVIVVDDGSTDESPRIIGSYGDRVTVVSKPNGGQASAFNAGVARSRGDYVVFLDSDDVLHPEHAANVVHVFAEHPDAGFAQFRLRVVNESLQPTGGVVPPAHVVLPTGDIAAAVARWELASCLAPGGALAFPRRAIGALFPVPEEPLRKGVDTYLVRAAGLAMPVVSTDLIAADYRSHGQNDSNLDTLNLETLRVGLRRHAACGELLRDFAAEHGLPSPVDPLWALDPLFLTQRLASLRADAKHHPFEADTRLRLARYGIRAVRRRRDIAVAGRVLHAVWFVAVAALPRPAAVRVATLLMLPISRGKLAPVVDRVVALGGRAVARMRRTRR
jgi:hypothetical protein